MRKNRGKFRYGYGADGGAEDDDVHVMDVNDFTTWDLETFALVPSDKILFPTDPSDSVTRASVQSLEMPIWHPKCEKTLDELLDAEIDV